MFRWLTALATSAWTTVQIAPSNSSIGMVEARAEGGMGKMEAGELFLFDILMKGMTRKA